MVNNPRKIYWTAAIAVVLMTALADIVFYTGLVGGKFSNAPVTGLIWGAVSFVFFLPIRYYYFQKDYRQILYMFLSLVLGIGIGEAIGALAGTGMIAAIKEWFVFVFSMAFGIAAGLALTRECWSGTRSKKRF